MSATVNLESVLSPFVMLTNAGVNSLTNLYYHSLNPQWDTAQKAASAGIKKSLDLSAQRQLALLSRAAISYAKEVPYERD